MKLKKNDNVIVISGQDKGKKGKILNVFSDRNMVIVEGVNIKKRHIKPRKSGQKGQIIEKTSPVDASNVMVIDPKTGGRSRIGKILKGEKYVRIYKKSGQEIK